jgi:hypothetical protein
MSPGLFLAEEPAAALPGDDIVPDANLRSTKGITIQASSAAIYPWLLQPGLNRGGMYSYDCLENLFRLKVHTTDRNEALLLCFCLESKAEEPYITTLPLSPPVHLPMLSTSAKSPAGLAQQIAAARCRVYNININRPG